MPARSHVTVLEKYTMVCIETFSGIGFNFSVTMIGNVNQITILNEFSQIDDL